MTLSDVPYLQCFQPLASSQWLELVFSRRLLSDLGGLVWIRQFISHCKPSQVGHRIYCINLQVATLCSKNTKMRLDMLHMAISDQFWLKAAQCTMFVCVLWGTMRVYLSLPLFFSGCFDIQQRQILWKSQNFWTHRSALMRSSLCTMVYYRWHH